MMTPKERWRAVMERRPVDRVPTDYWATGEVTHALKKHFDLRTDLDLWQKLGIDRNVGIGPALRDPHSEERDGANVWGLRHVRIAYAGGAGTYDEVVQSPLAGAETVQEIESYPWPDPSWCDYGSIPDQCREWKDYPIVGGSYEPFLLYTSLRGREQALEDLVVNPQIVEATLERIFEYHLEVISKTLEAAGGQVDFVYVAEDLGTQDSTIMSPGHFRRFLKPHMARMVELAHTYGAWAFHHDDGACWPLLPELCDIGIDVLNPIQWRCGNLDRRWLKREFGSRLVFHGAVDNQYTLPFGTVDEVRQEVRDNLEMLGDGGGYILAPCHNLQPITPIENILAMYDEAHGLA